MAKEKKPEGDQGGTATAEKPLDLRCVGACRGEIAEHEILDAKRAQCTVCQNVRLTIVGHDSPRGARWFVTKYPSWKTTIVPEDTLLAEGGRTVKQKGVYAVFKRIVKPRKLVDTQGELGTENPGGGDRNASRWMGVFFAVDPGPNPETKDQKLARKVIDFLRDHEYYRKTPQDNRLSPNPELVELTWDPQLKKTAEGAALSRRISLDQSDESVPVEEAPLAQRAKPGLSRSLNIPKIAAGALSEGE